MLLNYREYQDACYDLTSLALANFSLNSRNPKVRREFLQYATLAVFFEEDKLFLSTQYLNQTRIILLMNLFHEERGRLGISSSSWEFKNMISQAHEKDLGLRIDKINEFFNDILSQAVGDLFGAGFIGLKLFEVKRGVVYWFYKYFGLNTAKGLSR